MKVSLCLRSASELCVAISQKESTITAYNPYFSSSECSSLSYIFKNFPGPPQNFCRLVLCGRSPLAPVPPTFTHSPATPKLIDNPAYLIDVDVQVDKLKVLFILSCVCFHGFYGVIDGVPDGLSQLFHWGFMFTNGLQQRGAQQDLLHDVLLKVTNKLRKTCEI